MKEITEQGLQSFFARAGAELAAARKADAILAHHLGHWFNIFRLVRPDENMISDILREFLDPRGTHAQEDRFLRLFLDLCGIEKDEKEWASATGQALVQREYGTDSNGRRRRIDLVIIFPSGGAIGIENKPWAMEQDEQLEDYCIDLDRTFNGRFDLVYLSGHGTPPATAGKWSERVIRIDYLANPGSGSGRHAERLCSLHDWALRCAEVAQSDKIRLMLEEFANWLAETFPAVETEMVEKEKDHAPR